MIRTVPITTWCKLSMEIIRRLQWVSTKSKSTAAKRLANTFRTIPVPGAAFPPINPSSPKRWAHPLFRPIPPGIPRMAKHRVQQIRPRTIWEHAPLRRPIRFPMGCVANLSTRRQGICSRPRGISPQRRARKFHLRAITTARTRRPAVSAPGGTAPITEVSWLPDTPLRSRVRMDGRISSPTTAAAGRRTRT